MWGQQNRGDTNLRCLTLTKLAVNATVHEGLSWSAVGINVSYFCLLQSARRGSTFCKVNNRSRFHSKSSSDLILVLLRLLYIICAYLNIDKPVNTATITATVGLGSRG